MIASDKTQEGETQSVDVDGDRRPDEVRLHLDFDAPVGCQAFLVVESADGAVVEPVWVAGEAGGLPQPSVYALVDMNGRPGFEVVINEASGASTQFVGAYAVAGEDLVPVTAPGSDTGLFAFGGSVGHLEAVDCLSDGGVAVSQAVPGDSPDALENNIYEITRRIYRPERGQLRSADVERSEVALEELGGFEEFSAGPFGSCPAP